MWQEAWGTMIWGGGTAVHALPPWGQVVLAGLLVLLGWWVGRRTRRPLPAVLLFVALLALVPLSARALLSLPFTFTNGTVADADEVNANFEVLRAAVDATGTAVATTFDFNSFVDITPVGTRVSVSSLPLPAGNHLVTATLDALVVGAGTCELGLASGGGVLDRRSVSANLLPNFVPQQEISARIPVTLQTPLQLAAPDTVELQCVTFSTPTFTTLGLQVRAARMSAVSIASLSILP